MYEKGQLEKNKTWQLKGLHFVFDDLQLDMLCGNRALCGSWVVQLKRPYVIQVFFVDFTCFRFFVTVVLFCLVVCLFVFVFVHDLASFYTCDYGIRIWLLISFTFHFTFTIKDKSSSVN